MVGVNIIKQLKINEMFKTLDWVKNNIDQIKTIIIAIAIFLIISGGFFGGCKQKQVSKLLEKIVKLNINTDNLKNKIKKDKITIVDLENQKTTLKQKVKELEKIKDVLQGQEDSLNAILATIPPIIDKIPPDSSYRFLQAIYPFKSEIKPYKFNVEQVQAMHKDKLESYVLFDINKVLQERIINCWDEVIVLKDVNKISENQLKICQGINIKSEKIIDNKNEELKIKDKQLNKVKNESNLWKIATGIAAGLAVLIAL